MPTKGQDAARTAISTQCKAYLDGFIVHVQTERDTSLERALRVVRGVHVHRFLGLEPSILVVDHSVDHAIANGLGAYKLGVLRRVQRQLGTNVRE